MLRLEVYAIVKSIISGTLLGEDGAGASFNANELLFREGFADRVAEPYEYLLNHNARDRIDLMRSDNRQLRAHNNGQIAEEEDQIFIPPPSPRDGLVRTKLKGPRSPLELEYQSLCQSSRSKQVTIDGVNSVSLDQEPSAPTSRLVVASSVAIQDKSGRVCARDTTAMPAIPGLLALLAMTFAPKLEMRTDTHQSRYTGVLCGLGMDAVTESAIYADHDIEVVFDTEITNEDIRLINRIRYYMNLILADQAGGNMGPIHKSVVEEMFKLLKASRKRVDEEIWPQESYVWNKTNEAFIVKDTTYPTKPLDVFLPHSTIVLHEINRPNISWNFAV